MLLVCDLTREKTFEAVCAWKKEIDEWALTETKEGVGPLPVVLIANKVRVRKRKGKEVSTTSLLFNWRVYVIIVESINRRPNLYLGSATC